MAAIVTGLIPILRTAVDASATYKGRAVWFGFLCIRLVTLFVAEMPWFKLDSDFGCNVTADLCTRACFNAHFDRPGVMAWNFIFVLSVMSVLLMELFTAHVHSVFRKKTSQRSDRAEPEPPGEPKGTKEKMTLDMHGSRSAALFYLFSMALRVTAEVWFVYVLLFWNLPKLKAGGFLCQDVDGCPKLMCVLRATAEKRMSIYALASISSLVIISSGVFSLYFVVHYLCRRRTPGSPV